MAPALGYGSQPVSLTRALLVGTILSISAIAVVARILMDAGVMRTSFASIVMATATIIDVVGWTLFGVLLAQVTGLEERIRGMGNAVAADRAR